MHQYSPPLSINHDRPLLSMIYQKCQIYVTVQVSQSNIRAGETRLKLLSPPNFTADICWQVRGSSLGFMPMAWFQIPQHH